MKKQAEAILLDVREKTDSILLFSSVVGKDSILLTHLCANIFPRVVCVYMYLVKNLSYINSYKHLFLNRYKNIQYLDLPHYTLSGFLKYGYLGLKTDESQKKYSIADMDKLAREKTKIKWSVYGSKKSDSLNRRLQLNTYPDGICVPTNKAYPLMDYTNKMILSYIDKYRLPKPMSYKQEKSSGEAVDQGEYLQWLFDNYPEDLQKTFDTFPGTKLIYYGHQERV